MHRGLSRPPQLGRGTPKTGSMSKFAPQLSIKNSLKFVPANFLPRPSDMTFLKMSEGRTSASHHDHRPSEYRTEDPHR